MSISMDMSEVRTLATDLARIPDTVMKGLRPVVSKGALNIKTELQRDMRESPHFGQIAPAITYDLKVSGDGVEAEIGPSKGNHGGSLANIAYFGSSHGGGATVPDPAEALATEGDGFEQALSALLDGVL